MTKLRFFQVDAFTDVPFKGNPAAICLLDTELPDATMQAIAYENNLAETAFVLSIDNGFSLRWFTPTVEIKLCGHATLATAHILWEKELLSGGETARFFTRSGWLTVTKNEQYIQLDFPRFELSNGEIPPAIINALDVKPINAACASDGRFIIEVATEAEVRALKPDFTILKNYEVAVVTSQGDHSGYDFVSRSFTAAHGVDEDPVTGSSHCALAPYWAQKLGRNNLSAFQASARGGALKLQVAGDRVLIAGKAITVIEGFFNLKNIGD